MRSSILGILLAALVALAVGSAFAAAPKPAPALEWATVKGQVIWAGGAIPKNQPSAGVGPACLANGPILENKLVIDPKSKGVRWVLVWLADPKDARNARFVPPIHPSLKNPPPGGQVDIPCCTFEPRVLGIQANQNLLVKNTSTNQHGFMLTSVGPGPVVIRQLQPKAQTTIVGFVPKLIPTAFTCGIHPWMKGYIGTFAHPYFAVTDANGNFTIKNAPVGKFQVILWQEMTGFVLQKNPRIRGKVIEIKPKAVTDLGKIDLKLPEED